MIIGSVSGWLMLAGMMARPRATSSRTNSGVISLRDAGAEAVAVGQRRAAQILARGDVFHFLGDQALARIMKLGDIPARLGAQQASGRRGRIAARSASRPSSGHRLRACVRGRHIPRHRHAPGSSRGARRPGPCRYRSRPNSSVYGPDVSYSRTGGSPPDSATSRNGTPPKHQLARTGQRATGDGNRLVENGLVHPTSPYAGLNRIRF